METTSSPGSAFCCCFDAGLSAVAMNYRCLLYNPSVCPVLLELGQALFYEAKPNWCGCVGSFVQNYETERMCRRGAWAPLPTVAVPRAFYETKPILQWLMGSLVQITKQNELPRRGPLACSCKILPGWMGFAKQSQIPGLTVGFVGTKREDHLGRPTLYSKMSKIPATEPLAYVSSPVGVLRNRAKSRSHA